MLLDMDQGDSLQVNEHTIHTSREGIKKKRDEPFFFFHSCVCVLSGAVFHVHTHTRKQLAATVDLLIQRDTSAEAATLSSSPLFNLVSRRMFTYANLPV